MNARPGIVLLALTALASAQDPAPTPTPPKPAPAAPKVLAVGDTLPKGLALRAIDGKKHALDALRGKVVVLHFWSTTCPYEIVAEPKLNALADEFAKQDVVVLAIAANAGVIGEPPAEEAFDEQDVDKRPYAALRSKAKETKANHTILVDHGGKTLGKLLDAKTTPHCYVFDKDGKLAYTGALDDDPQGRKKADATRYVHDAVRALLAGEQPALTTTKPYG